MTVTKPGRGERETVMGATILSCTIGWTFTSLDHHLITGLVNNSLGPCSKIFMSIPIFSHVAFLIVTVAGPGLVPMSISNPSLMNVNTMPFPFSD